MNEKTAEQDIAALAKGGRTNFLGFLLRRCIGLDFKFQLPGRELAERGIGVFRIGARRANDTLALKAELAHSMNCGPLFLAAFSIRSKIKLPFVKLNFFAGCYVGAAGPVLSLRRESW